MNSLPEMNDAALASIMNNKVLISDAAGMFKKPLRKNMKPYEEAAVRTFNRMVDEWAENLLFAVGDGGYVQSSLVSRAWGVYFEGVQTRMMEKLFGSELMPEQAVRNAVKFLHETPVDKLVKNVGLSALQMMWGSLTQALRYEIIHQKRLRIFSCGEDPSKYSKEWFSNANMNMRLSKGDETPYNIPKEILMDIGEKIQVINQCAPRPVVDAKNNQTKFKLSEAAKMYHTKIPKNSSRYENDAKSAYNALVRKWDEDMLAGMPGYASTEYDIKEIMQMWSCYFEGSNTNFVTQNLSNILCLSDDKVQEYIKLLISSDVSYLIRECGSTSLDIIWFMVTTTIRCKLMEMKRDAIFSKSTDAVDWWGAWNENSKIVKGETRPFDLDVEEFSDIGEKVVTILSNAPEVATPRGEEE